MKKKLKSVVKGAPSGLVISLLVHAAAFMLAGLLVVFSVVKKEEVTFVPPPAVERPKMKLKKPKVKVKKTAKPASPTRIMAKVTKAEMPDLQLPELGGAGSGFGGIGDLGGFETMPDLSEVSVFGGGQSIGNDFVGTFYDLNRGRTGRDLPAFQQENFVDIVNAFLNSGWKTSKLTRFYRSPKKLYATTFMMPMMPSILAPFAFDEDDTGGYFWLAHYKGQLVHKEGITFRFVGKADDILIVRVNGEIVLIANHDNWIYNMTIGNWQSSSSDNAKWRVGGAYANVGDWITLEPGVPLDMEVLIGEIPGGGFGAMLCVEEKDVEYERSYGGGIVLPVFKTEEPSLDLMDGIYNFLIEDGASLTDGPVFRDFDSGGGGRLAAGEPDQVEPAVPTADTEDKLRIWTGLDGKTMEAEFVNTMGDKVVLKDARGKMRKIPLDQVSEEDRAYIELAQPPSFDFSFTKSTSQRSIKLNPLYNHSSANIPKIIDYVFTAKLKQTSARSYGSELKVEFFAIGEEIDGDNYILFDRQESRFVPTGENERSHTFSGNPVRLMDYIFGEQRRGEKYGGYLITVTDVRGKIIDYGTSHEWLFENLEKLKKLPVGRHFDKSVNRVHPPRPKRNY